MGMDWLIGVSGAKAGGFMRCSFCCPTVCSGWFFFGYVSVVCGYWESCIHDRFVFSPDSGSVGRSLSSSVFSDLMFFILMMGFLSSQSSRVV